MDNARKIAILGVGHDVPDRVRDNNDPIFAEIKTNPSTEGNLFGGLNRRRVLDSGHGLIDLMTRSARAALSDAGLAVADVGMLLGSGSVGQYYAPNDLAAVHRELGLSTQCRVMSLNTEYTNFHDGMKLAHDLIQCGTVKNALVVCGNNWTHHVDYREPVSSLAADGAGAAVVGWTTDPQAFHLVDWENETQTAYFGALRMAPRLVSQATALSGQPQPLYSTPLMKVDDQRGADAIRAFGMKMPPVVIDRLLARHGLSSAEVSLISHQSSGTVFQYWSDQIRPARYLTTLDDFGDMVSASVPVTLAKCFDQIETDKLVLMGIGMEMRVTALLYSRGEV